MAKAIEHLAFLIRDLPEMVEHWTDTDCIEWDMGRFDDGYGAVNFERKTQKAHRVSYRLFHNRFPVNFACHHCDNKACVNPHHLFDGDARANLGDASKKGRLPTGTDAPGHIHRQFDPDRIRDLLACGCSQTDVAKWLGCTQPYVSLIARGRFVPLNAKA